MTPDIEHIIVAKLDRLEEALYGNGDPAKSITSALARVEVQLTSAAVACDKNAVNVDALTKSVGDLTRSVGEHHKTIHLATLLKSPKFLGYALVAFMIVNSLIHYMDPVVRAAIKAWTGIDLP